MSYHVYENTRYDKAAQESIPYSYTLSWNIYTNSPQEARKSPDRTERYFRPGGYGKISEWAYQGV